MKLLQTEIDVTPGERPNRQPRAEGWVGDGCAVLEITNATEWENSFQIRVECDLPFWQSTWYQILPLPVNGDENQPPKGKPDAPGKLNQTRKIYLGGGRNSTRQFLIEFYLPKASESRAGAYPFKIIVEAKVTDHTVQSASRTTEIAGTLLVRSFYAYEVEYEVPERETKRWSWRRRGDYEVLVHNRGNDWLYAELKLGKSTALIPSLSIKTVAVPPPEPGKTSTRSVPLQAVTKLKKWQGEPVPNEIPLRLARLDAPSLARLPFDVATGGAADPRAGVVREIPNEEMALAEPGILIYRPTIPATLTDFFKSIGKNIKGILLWIAGLVAFFTLAMIVFDRQWRVIQGFDVAGGTSAVKRDADPPYAAIGNDGKLRLVGAWLDRAEFEFFTYEGKDSGSATAVASNLEGRLVSGREFSAPNVYEVVIDLSGMKQLHDSRLIRIVARRRIPVIGAIPPVLNSTKFEKYEIRIGTPRLPKPELPTLQLAKNELGPEENIKVLGPGLGNRPGKVFVAGELVTKGVRWTDEALEIPVPPDLKQSGDLFNVAIQRPGDRTPIALNGIRVKTETVDPNDIESIDDPNAKPGGPEPIVPEVLPTSPTQPNPKPAPASPSPGDPPVGGYAETLEALGSGNRRAFSKAQAAVTGSDSESKSLRAYLQASLGQSDEAQQELPPYDARPEAARAAAYHLAAWGRVFQTLGKTDEANRAFLKASETLWDAVESGRLPRGEGNGFPDLAYALFKRDVKKRAQDAAHQADRALAVARDANAEKGAAEAIRR